MKKELLNTNYARVEDIIKGDMECPLPLKVIPNSMGINLCSVDAISWEKQQDGQLVSLTIHFKPDEKRE